MGVSECPLLGIGEPYGRFVLDTQPHYFHCSQNSLLNTDLPFLQLLDSRERSVLHLRCGLCLHNIFDKYSHVHHCSSSNPLCEIKDTKEIRIVETGFSPGPQKHFQLDVHFGLNLGLCLFCLGSSEDIVLVSLQHF